MSATQEETLTLMEHVLWVVDHSYIEARPNVADDGTLTPGQPLRARAARYDAAQLDEKHGAQDASGDADGRDGGRISLADFVEEVVRPDKRGVKRAGLTARVWLALFIAAGAEGQHKISYMHRFATGMLPRETQWDLGILTMDKKGQVRTLTEKQLYTFLENLTRHLDTDPAFGLDDAEIARRTAVVDAITDALVRATHVVNRKSSSYAVDESGVWAWTKARRSATDVSLADPSDQDVFTGAENEPAAKAQPAQDDPEPDIRLSEPWSEDTPPDEDSDDSCGLADGPDGAADLTAGPIDRMEEADRPDATGSGSAVNGKKRPGVKPCWLARWASKTHKNGGRSTYFGYGLHTLVWVADVIRGGGKPARTDKYAEPHLIEQFAVTAGSTDIVDVTLGMIKAVLGRGRAITDLIGDRHYSYKKYERWVSKLWRLGIKQVLDLRQNDLGPIDYDGAIILAGTPHLGVPKHLWSLERPGRGAGKEEVDAFAEAIRIRQQYAMVRKNTAWGNRDGKTRWVAPSRAGTVGCAHIPGSVEIALAHGLPVIDAAEHDKKWCEQEAVLIPAGKHMKHQQEDYWGSETWITSFNRRTFVESVFGMMKSHHTGNIRRGFMCLTGQAMVSITMAAAVVNYNLRELENWHARASEFRDENPHGADFQLLDEYSAHPLHQTTEMRYGHTMLTAAQQAELDERCAAGRARETSDEDPAGRVGDAPLALAA